MGIPSIKYITVDDLAIPDGWEIKKDGILKDVDMVWSGNEGKFVSSKEFPNSIGRDVSKFWAVVQKCVS